MGAQGAGEDVEVHENDGDGVAADSDEGVGVGGGVDEGVGVEVEGGLADGDEVVEEVFGGVDEGAIREGVEGSSKPLGVGKGGLC